MAPRAFLLAGLVSIAGLIPSGLAGPACAKKNWQNSECIQKCRHRWGYPGFMMGNDPWGGVIQSAPADAWDSYISAACGTPSAQSSPTFQGNLGTPTTSTSAEFTTDFSTSTTSQAQETINSTTFLSSTSVFFTSSEPAPEPTTSSSAPPPPPPSTSSEPPPPPPPTTSEAPPPPETTSQAPPPPETTQEAPPPAQTSISSSGGGGSSGNSDIDAFLKAHNDFRAQHGAEPLTWSNNAASKAQEWANRCVFEHSGGQLGSFGENLAAGTGDYTIEKAVKAWTDEAPEYNPSNPNPSHFTQAVWKGSKELGCATQICDFLGPNTLHVVCEYSPAGNVIGAFAENVQV